MTTSDDCFRQGLARLDEDDFGDPFHAMWFTTLTKYAKISPTSARMTEAVAELQKRNTAQFKTCYEVARLVNELAWCRDVHGLFRFYLKQVLECSQRRQLDSVSHELTSLAHDQCDDWLATAEARIRAIRERTTATNGPVTVGDTICDTVAHIDRERETRMISTGLPDVDTQLGGLCPGENVIIAAGTGGGKTALALAMAIHNSRIGRSVLYFSLEMQRRDIEKRILSHECAIDLAALFRGKYTAQQRRAMADKSIEIAQWKLAIADHPKMTIDSMRETCTEHVQSIGLDLVVVDYLQLLQPDNSRSSLREQVSQLSRDLKLLAREFRVPVLTLCQLSREGAKDTEPQLWHLKESGSIEADADLVLFVYPGGEPSKDQRKRGIAPVWLKCAKNRRGEVGRIPLQFIKPYQQFSGDTPQFESAF